MAELNGYQADVVQDVTTLLRKWGLAHKVSIEIKGIVGGDFTVVGTRTDRDRRTPDSQRLKIEVNP